MDNETFSRIRRRMGKTQKQMSQLLGVSLKAVQSFEQGWRNIPVHVERQLLFLLARRETNRQRTTPCWKVLKCPSKVKQRCPAWEFQTGDLCWFINGTICHGEPERTWHEKMDRCRECIVFQQRVPEKDTMD
ncbi:MAG: helix-turn-helix domain-containing protein [Desulfobacteraceae bacterium]|jgi:DNA-binding XRE family transcriptional regulator|nr:helix-turn-helix domain-containing protein [Desulfobacteraceae bacterium]